MAADHAQGKDADQRHGQQTQGSDKPDPLMGEDLLQIHAGNEHAGDHHGGGADHDCQRVHCALDKIGQPDTQGKDDDARKDGDHIHIEEHLLNVNMYVVADHRFAVAPMKNDLHAGKGTGVYDPLRPQQSADQGDDQVAGIGINDRGLLHRLQTQGLFQQRDHQHQSQLDHQAGDECQHQAGADLRGAVDLESGDDAAGADEIKREHRERMAILRTEEAAANHHIARQHDQKQGCNFSKQCQTHRFTSLFTISANIIVKFYKNSRGKMYKLTRFRRTLSVELAVFPG